MVVPSFVHSFSISKHYSILVLLLCSKTCLIAPEACATWLAERITL